VPAGATLNSLLLVAGSTYRLPAGNYTLNFSIQPLGPLCIQGAGSDAATGTVVRFTTAVSGRASAVLTGGDLLGLFNLSITLDPSSTARDAGAVRVSNGGTLRAEGVAFRGVGGTAAGAVRADGSGTTVNMTDAVFEDCFAKGTGTGGAIFIASGASADLYGATTVVRTYAAKGGAFRVETGTLRFHGPVTATNATVSNAFGWAGPGEGGRAGGARLGRAFKRLERGVRR
jgi:hypothetical protein